MRRLLAWPLGPSLLLLAALSLLGLTSAIDVVSTKDTSRYLSYDALLLPRYYKSATDELCAHNGVRFTSCEADNGRVVKLDEATRSEIHQYVLSKPPKAGLMQALVNVMLVGLDESLSAAPGAASTGLKGALDRLKGARGGGLRLKQSDFDPGVDGPAAAKKLGAPRVSLAEDKCYLDWLNEKDWGEAEFNTVLNELYVRHVAITQADSRMWDVESPTGCYPARKSVVGGGAKAKRSVEGEALEMQERSMHDADGEGIDDDMEVYHRVMGTHLKDPWEKYRQFEQGKALTPGEFGHRKRSMGKVWVGKHHHAKREDSSAQQQPYQPTSPFDDDPAYRNGLPTAPIQQGAAGSGATETGDGTTGGSAISSKPHGFAASVTGGGSATPVIPKDIHELTKLLQDPSPQVIHLDKEYDFRGSEGVCTDCAGCVPDSYAKCPSKGQLAIDNGQGWCNGRPPHKVTYDKAGLNPIRIASDKTVVGITPNAAMRGKGLRIAHHKNIILHNFRIDEISPQHIWGGDGVTIYDSDLVWIDKLTFRMIGRQFIVTGYQAAGRVTISNCFFDCKTNWSATCDDSHYWTVLGYGKSDKVTFSGNLMQHCSGRSPRIANPDNEAGDSVWHVVNSVFDHNTGHSLDMGPGISALIEGNVFTDVAQTSLHEASPGRAFAPSDKAVCSQCRGPLGRDCQPNAYNNAQPVPSTTSPAQVLKDVAQEKMSGALPPAQVVASVGKTAGCAGSKDAAGKAGQDGTKQEGYEDGTKQEGYGNGDGGAQMSGSGVGAGAGAGAGSGAGSGYGSGATQPGAGSGSGTGTGAYIPGIGWGGASSTSPDPNQPALPGGVIGGPDARTGYSDTSSTSPDPNKPALPGAVIGGPAFIGNGKETQPEGYGAAAFPQQPANDEDATQQQKEQEAERKKQEQALKKKQKEEKKQQQEAEKEQDHQQQQQQQQQW